MVDQLPMELRGVEATRREMRGRDRPLRRKPRTWRATLAASAWPAGVSPSRSASARPVFLWYCTTT